MYVKGFHNIKRDKGIGANHIKMHLGEGEIKIDELLNLGNSMREYIKNFNKPFVDLDKKHIYEWQDKNKNRFRLVVDDIKGEGLLNAPLSPFDKVIISFCSDRNLNKRMEFKNPKIKEHYQNLEKEKLLVEASPAHTSRPAELDADENIIWCKNTFNNCVKQNYTTKYAR